METLLLICTPLAAGFFIHGMLEPMKTVEKTVRPQSQFVISDIFSLMFLAQLCLGVTSLLAKNWVLAEGVSVIIGGYLLLSAGLLWWRGVSMLTGLGIFHTGRRAAFLAVILPLAAVGAVATPVALATAMYSGFERRPAMLALLLVIPPLCFGGRMLTNWVLAGATRQPNAATEASDYSVDHDATADASSTAECVATQQEAE